MIKCEFCGKNVARNNPDGDTVCHRCDGEMKRQDDERLKQETAKARKRSCLVCCKPLDVGRYYRHERCIQVEE